MKRFLCVLALLAFVFVLPACEEEGAMEKAGREIDEAAESAGDALEDAKDERKKK